MREAQIKRRMLGVRPHFIFLLRGHDLSCSGMASHRQMQAGARGSRSHQTGLDPDPIGENAEGAVVGVAEV
jgi:hypothetical protein